MNVPGHKALQQMIEKAQSDHPIGCIALRYADQAIKRAIPAERKGKRSRKGSTRRHRSNTSSGSSAGEESKQQRAADAKVL